MFIIPYVLRIGEDKFGWQINEFNLAGGIFIALFVFMVVLSLLTKPPRPEQVEGLVWRPSMTRLPQAELDAGYPWYKNLWLWCAIWIGTFGFIYYKFW